ncbi:hypothetical protein [Hephaestia mangrovi]|uniref:hypothetical protein n=1 Tax=Hephaestia mangrovi TaxID=2873268 RepID=UPI001CA65BE5|nr:hypothetical protein [Hephaestia mangrovi]MBY8826549.1 hypothetical protein [Hephaestia mangrovi]
MADHRQAPSLDREWERLAAKAEEAWLLPLTAGTAWWNAGIDLWFGGLAYRPEHGDHDQLAVPELLETDGEYALFA